MTATDEGRIRILFADASGTRKDVIFEAATELLKLGASDPRLAIIMPMSQGHISEDDKLLIEGNFLAATSIDYVATETGTTKMRIPVTIKNKKTGVKNPRMLRHPDFASADVTITTAATWYTLGEYTVSAQEELKLGYEIAENSRIYIVLEEAA